MTTVSLLRHFFSYYRPYKGLFVLDLTCAVVSGLLELGFPLAVSSVVDKLLPGQNWPLILLASAGFEVARVVPTRSAISIVEAAPR